MINDPLYQSSAIPVGMIDEEGSNSVPMQSTGADIMTYGIDVRVADTSGGYQQWGGTSFASPWAAGEYGRFLMHAWDQGWLERVETEDGVKLRVTGDHSSAPGLGPGDYLEGRDVLDLLSRYATYKYGMDRNQGAIPQTFGAVQDQDRSAWMGYGALTTTEWDDLAYNWTRGLPPQPEQGDGHALIQQYRYTMRDATLTAGNTACEVAMEPYVCPKWRLYDDSWYD